MKPSISFMFVLLIFLSLSTVGCSLSPSAPPVVTVVYPTPAATTIPPALPTLPGPTAIPGPTPVPQRISFAPGQSTTSVNGTLTANGMAKWVMRISGGQTLNANLVPTNGKARLAIVGTDGTVLISDDANAIQWNGPVPSLQDYTITITATDNTAPSYLLQVTVPPLAQATFAPAPAKRISFAPGGISATVQGTTRAVDVDHWVIAAQAGQTMNVNLVIPPGGQAALVIYGADGTVLISDHASAMSWSGPLPKTQDYFIDVKPETGAVSYSLQVTIPPR